MPPLRDLAGLQVIQPVLTNLALAYRFGGGVYDRIVANMDVAYNAGQYPVWSQADLMRLDGDDGPVPDRSETPEIDASYSLEDYLLKNYRRKVSLTPEERAQAHPALRMERMKLSLLLDHMAMRRERRLANVLRTTGRGGQLTAGGTPAIKWNAANATIEKDIKAARKDVYDRTGQHADTIVMTWDVAYAVALDPAIREIIKYTVDGNMILSNGERILPRQLHGLNVEIVGADMVNTAREGAPASLVSIWGDKAVLLKRGSSNAWGVPATVYALRGRVLDTDEGRTNRTNSGGPGYALVDRWAEADPPVDYIRAWEKIEEKVVAPDIAYELHTVLA